MVEINTFEDAGGVSTELVDGKNRLTRRDLVPYLDKLNEIEKLTVEALAAGNGYEHRLTVLTGAIISDDGHTHQGRGENAVKAVNNFRAAGKLMDNEYTVSIQEENLPEQEGQHQRTLLRIALVDKREDTPISAAKKAFGVARRNLANAGTRLQAAPNDEAVKEEVRGLIKVTVSAMQEADKLVKADAENQTQDQMSKHTAFMQVTKAMVSQLQDASKAAPKAEAKDTPAAGK